jgi:hypothetical protein
MVGAAPPERVDLVVTVSPALLAVVGAALLLWIILLTTLVLRRCREPWWDDGRPVYQRLTDGRIRFSWGVPGNWPASSAERWPITTTWTPVPSVRR